MAQSLENAATKGTANTALGIGIGALGLELLRGGIFGHGLFGGKDLDCKDHYHGHGYPAPVGYGYGYGHGYGHYCGCGCGCGPTP